MLNTTIERSPFMSLSRNHNTSIVVLRLRRPDHVGARSDRECIQIARTPAPEMRRSARRCLSRRSPKKRLDSLPPVYVQSFLFTNHAKLRLDDPPQRARTAAATTLSYLKRDTKQMKIFRLYTDCGAGGAFRAPGETGARPPNARC
ncbi:hypothetical protein EVAR_66173_1 [Eumeta japonica]|uniref:Uncharacterized protein n=1 Tax=Eumeta variegata TaxID=151549 RepID=A0A4C1ZNA2_EUMVA|nr:hypothetical protein EVAR_66173_1 [Eumeta japonica]